MGKKTANFPFILTQLATLAGEKWNKNTINRCEQGDRAKKLLPAHFNI